jgi:Holliday junction DNA helicase RuvB
MIERPASFKEFIGQKRVKNLLEVAVESAKKRGEPLDHVLFYGPPGTGKTTLSLLIAKELGAEIKLLSAPAIERKGELLGVLTSLSDGDVLFIDEIHRLSRAVEELLYSAMEDFRVDIVMGSRRSVSIEIAPFTLIGATTRLSSLSAPLRSRFGLICRLELYTKEELREVARRGALKLGLKFKEEALSLLASCSRGTPRILNQILKRVRDYAVVKGWHLIGKEEVSQVLRELGIDENGLGEFDRKMLSVMATTFRGGPVGLSSLAAILNEESETIEEVHEPFLLEAGFIAKTPRGRVLTPKGYQAVGKFLNFYSS